MSMEVDFNTPLSNEERNYLNMRGRLADIQRADDRHEVTDADVPEGDGTGPQMRPLGMAEDAATERQRLLDRLRELDAVDGPDEDSNDEELSPYEQWTNRELDDELGRRNLAKGGTKAEKVNRLYEDDATMQNEQPPV